MYYRALADFIPVIIIGYLFTLAVIALIFFCFYMFQCFGCNIVERIELGRFELIYQGIFLLFLAGPVWDWFALEPGVKPHWKMYFSLTFQGRTSPVLVFSILVILYTSFIYCEKVVCLWMWFYGAHDMGHVKENVSLIETQALALFERVIPQYLFILPR